MISCHLDILDKYCEALLDTGSTVNFIKKQLVSGVEYGKDEPVYVRMLDNSLVRSRGCVQCNVLCNKIKFAAKFHVMDNLCCDIIIGNATLMRQPQLWSGVRGCAGQDKGVHDKDFITVIKDKDFDVRYEGGRWTVRWKWKETEGEPQFLSNVVGQYKVPDENKDDFDAEIKSWIDDGILKLYEGDSSTLKGIIPLMSVYQSQKGKTRPVLDYRELNCFLSSHTADADVCAEKLRKWRRMGNNLSVVDLRRAFLQIHVESDLQLFQGVKYDGKLFVMTRMAFGMNFAPKAMTSVVRWVLAQSRKVLAGTDSYIDDVVVNEDLISADAVSSHLTEWGLESKLPERMSDPDGVRILGLRVRNTSSETRWFRDGLEPCLMLDDILTRRKVFSICGKLTAHYPVCRWVRVACSFIKRITGSTDWDDEVDSIARDMLVTVLGRIKEEKPIGGIWAARGEAAEVWFDASSLAMGALVKISENVVEDASWLRPESEVLHINIAELNAAVKGLNLALLWELNDITMYTDSSSCYSWLNDTISGQRKVRTKGICEMLVKRRLAVIKEIIDAYNLRLKVKLIPSTQNLADPLTRVPSEWLKRCKPFAAAASVEEVRELHDIAHMGRERTEQICLSAGCDKKGLRDTVNSVVASCDQCNSIDPANLGYPSGTSRTNNNWERLAVDFTHYEGQIYLTVLDCCSGFCIWRVVGSQRAGTAITELQNIFVEWGPPTEVLSDHVPFASKEFQDFLSEWRVKWVTRPEGNPVERNHRSVKRLAARTGKLPSQMAFWFNRTSSEPSGLSPFDKLNLGWESRMPLRNVSDAEDSENEEDIEINRFSVGNSVYVKPNHQVSCTTRWRGPFEITKVFDNKSVEVNGDGIRRHVSHLRLASPVAHFDEDDQDHEMVPDNDEQNEDEPQESSAVERRHVLRSGNEY